MAINRTAPYMPRSTRIAAVLVVLAGLAGHSPARADNTLINQQPSITGSVQLHFDFRDRQNNQQNAALSALPAPLLSALPSSFALQNSPLLTAPLSQQFAALWQNISAETCTTITSQIGSHINRIGTDGSNTAYMIGPCTPRGFVSLVATEQTKWVSSTICTFADPNCIAEQLTGTNTVNGHRLVLDYFIPNNVITFYLTSKGTCSTSNTDPLCPTDPQFWLVYDIDIQLIATSTDLNNPNSLNCPFTVQTRQNLSVEALTDSNPIPTLESAAQSTIKGLNPVSIVSSYGVALVGPTATMLLKGAADGLAAKFLNPILVTTVGAKLALAIPGPIDPTSVPALRDLQALLTNCRSAGTLGFTQFDASAIADATFAHPGSPGLDLNFIITHPIDSAPPTLTNATAVAAKNLFQPQLTGSVPQLQAGQNLTVNGVNFVSAQTKLSWTDAGSGNPIESDVQYCLKGSTQDCLKGSTQAPTIVMLKRTGPNDNGNGYSPAGLKSGTTYEFQVRDCDIVTCTPYTAPLDVAVGGQGSNMVTLYLDAIAPANKLATATVNTAGAFSASVTIGAKTPAGQHNILAAVGASNTPAGQPYAVAVVAPGQSLKPTLEVEDSRTHVKVNNIVPMQPFVLRGSGFGVGQIVVTMANSTTPLWTGVVTNSNAQPSFSATITAPGNTPSGNQQIVAIQTVNGKTVETPITIFVEATAQ